MSVDSTGVGLAGATCTPTIATIADDDFAARRIESALAAGGLAAASRGTGDGELLAVTGVTDPDVLVVAFGRGVTERDQRIRRIRRRTPDTHLVAVIPEDSRRGVRRALEAGADGVVFEAALEAALSQTVRAVLAGQVAVPAVARHAVDWPTLSAREKQVLTMVVSGQSNKAIASHLFLAESTVKCHLSSVFTKLGVRSRNEAAELVLHSEPQLGITATAPAAHLTKERMGQ